MHLTVLTAYVVNSVWQKDGSASPHGSDCGGGGGEGLGGGGEGDSGLGDGGGEGEDGAISACAGPCADGVGADGGGDGGGAGQKKQDPSHFVGNGALLHLTRSSWGDVNSALQNDGSASPHGVGGAACGDGNALLMLRNWTRRRVLRICMLARRTMTVVAL